VPFVPVSVVIVLFPILRLSCFDVCSVLTSVADRHRKFSCSLMMLAIGGSPITRPPAGPVLNAVTAQQWYNFAESHSVDTAKAVPLLEVVRLSVYDAVPLFWSSLVAVHENALTCSQILRLEMQ